MTLGSKCMLVLIVGSAALALAVSARVTAHTNGYAGTAPASQAQAAISVHQVLPATADPQATGPNSPNLALVGPASTWNGMLLVFLPGTGGQPACCRTLLTQAAALGFHAIGLTYNNSTAVGERCLNNLDCYGSVRQNEFDGTSPGYGSDVPPQDGVDHRLAALLAYLSSTYPNEGWGSFLAGQAPSYAAIVLAGHSQGGGEAAFIATERRAAGVVTLSSPPDTNDQQQAAPWLAGVSTGATPLSSYYAFVHTSDPFGARIRADWTAMGLDALGPLTSVDGAAAPYSNSHELISSAPLPSVLLAAHDSTGVDNAQPLCPDGTPAYAPVWSYLLQSAAGLPLSGLTSACGD